MTMTCEELIPFLDAYVDEEFDERERAEMEAHLDICEDCRSQVEFLLQYKQAFKASFDAPKAPDSLKLRILEQLEQTDVEPAPAPAQPRRGVIWRYGWLAAPLAAGIALTVLLPQFTVAPATSKPLPVIEQAVNWHRANYPIEVTGPSATDVSHWFRGKVDFPVRLPHFPSAVSLLGGRIAHIENQNAAYVLYQVNEDHDRVGKLSVMLFHGDGMEVPRNKIRNIDGHDVAFMNDKGYDVAILQDNGITYTMTSAMPKKEFKKIVTEVVER